MMAREHNRLEQRLHRINPQWNGERLFQETRRILIAQWQYIVYEEYLPLLLGKRIMDQYDLTNQATGYANGMIIVNVYDTMSLLQN